MTYINILIISAIMVFIIDLSGLIEEVKRGIHTILKKKYPLESIKIPKPFSCSLCMSWWSGIIYLLAVHQFTFPNLGYVALISFMTPVIQTVLIFTRDIFSKLFDLLYTLLKM